MKKIFDIVESRVILNENILLIPAFKRVVERYGDNALDVFCFIYYFCDYKSPFSDYTPEQKEETLMELYNPEGIFTTEDQEVIDAINQYNEFQWTPSLELLEAAKIALHKIAAYLKDTPIIDGRDGNFNQINTAMGKIGANLSSYDELKTYVEKEMEKSTIRGGKHVSSRER